MDIRKGLGLAWLAPAHAVEGADGRREPLFFAPGAKALFCRSGKLLCSGLFAVSSMLFASTAFAVADLVINQQVAPNPGPAGGEFTYTVEVGNIGPSAATGVVLTDNLPVNAQFVSAVIMSPPAVAGNCASVPAVGANGTVTCDLGNLPFTPTPSKAVVQIKMVLPVSGVETNTASASGNETDPNPSNSTNQAEKVTVQASSDLTMTGTSSAANVVAGEAFSYTATVGNAGPNAFPANGKLHVNFPIPAGATVTAVPTGAGWTCTPTAGYPISSAQTIACEHSGPLAVGGTADVLTFPATLNAAGTISAAFSVSGVSVDGKPVLDKDTSNNTAAVVVTSAPGTDVGVEKKVSADVVAQGDPVTFTIIPKLLGGESLSGKTITVTDVLDEAVYEFVSIAPGAGWTCGSNSAGGLTTVTCTRADYAGGNFTDMPTIALVVKPKTSGQLDNTAKIDVTGVSDPHPNNNEYTVPLLSSNAADLRMHKSVSWAAVVQGQGFSYSLYVDNLGPLAVPAGQVATVKDTLPDGIQLAEMPTGTDWACTVTQGGSPAVPPVTSATGNEVIVSCDYSKGLAKGAQTPVIRLAVNAQFPSGSRSNQACVALGAGDRVDNNAVNNCVGAGILITSTSADLVLKKTASPSIVEAGNPLTYTITVTNTGPDAAVNVVVSDPLNDLVATGGLQSVAASGGGSCTLGDVNGFPPLPALPTNGTSHSLKCKFATLGSGASETVTVTVLPATGGDRTNKANVIATGTGDPNHLNNVADVTTIVLYVADLEVLKTASAATIPEAAELTYTASVKNHGPSAARNLTLTDTLPANGVYMGGLVVSGGGTCIEPVVGATGGTLACEWTALTKNAQHTVTYKVRSLEDEAGNTLDNAVVVSAAGSDDKNAGNDTAATSTPITPPVIDLQVEISDAPDLLHLGDTTVYTIKVRNNGPSIANNVVMTNIFPVPDADLPPLKVNSAVFSYQGGLTQSVAGTCTEPAIGSMTDSVLECTWPELAADGEIIITYVMKGEEIRLGDPTGTGFSKATVKADEAETEPNNNEDLEDTTIIRDTFPGTLEPEKSASATEALPGMEFTYTLVAKNTGTDPLTAAHGAQLSDTLDASLEFVSATAPECTYLALRPSRDVHRRGAEPRRFEVFRDQGETQGYVCRSANPRKYRTS